MYINVLVEIENKKLDRTFTYHVPNTLVDDIEVGKRVEVPFGKLTLEGFIMELNVKPEVDDIKDIIRIVDEKSILNEEIYTDCRRQWCRQIYFVPNTGILKKYA